MSSHICCVGFDPRLEDIPKAIHASGSPKRTLTDFFALVLESTPDFQSFKLNFAFFEQYGLEGLEALSECITMASSLGKYIIGDVKRGDIDITNRAYIHALTHVWKVQAATFHPLMGKDTFKWLKDVKLRPYFLIKTSNPDASDLQTVMVDGKKQVPFFIHCLKYYLKAFPEGGFVIGGTDLEALQQCIKIFKDTQSTPYLLIPGVGRQGAIAKEILNCLKTHYKEKLSEKVLIPISSGIIYAAPSTEGNIQAVRLAIQTAAQSNIEKLSI